MSSEFGVKIHDVETGHFDFVTISQIDTLSSKMDRSMVEEAFETGEVITCGKTVYEPCFYVEK